MAEEPQHAAQGVADDRGADVAHVHGLGHVGGRVVDHVGPRRRDRRHAQPRIAHRGLSRSTSQSSRTRRLMKPGPAISGGWQKSSTSQPRDRLPRPLRAAAAADACPAAWRNSPGSRRTSASWLRRIRSSSSVGLRDQSRQGLTETLLQYREKLMAACCTVRQRINLRPSQPPPERLTASYRKSSGLRSVGLRHRHQATSDARATRTTCA